MLFVRLFIIMLKLRCYDPNDPNDPNDQKPDLNDPNDMITGSFADD